MNNPLLQLFQQNHISKVCILGFGREGKSTLDFLRQLPDMEICIADKQEVTLSETLPFPHPITLQTGNRYLDHLEAYDWVIKSPGVLLPEDVEQLLGHRLTSQTALFLEAYHEKVVGITGTKGKSTTSRLILHLLQQSGKRAILAGNIGIPPFSIHDQIDDETWIVYELSAHQLKKIGRSPHIALLLNIFAEHLDYFGDIQHYATAKGHIGTLQDASDTFIYLSDNEQVKQLISGVSLTGKAIALNANGSDHLQIQSDGLWLDGTKIWAEQQGRLRGRHNLLNTVFALEAVRCCGVDYATAVSALPSFEPLEHRLEYVGCVRGKHFYNDSIATVPEATLAAVAALGKVDTLILGGMDRGIDYASLIDFLSSGSIPHLLFTGRAGERMLSELKQRPSHAHVEVELINNWNVVVQHAVAATPPGGTCLLSPAAASYGQFRDFEERGRFFKERVIKGE